LKYMKEGVLPDEWYLTGTFGLLIEKEILTPEELENALEKWQNWLKGYYDEYAKKQSSPLELEYNFRWKNLLFEDIPITGKIDKIEILNIPSTSALPQGGGMSEGQGGVVTQLAFFKDKVSLIDYKTWGIKTLGQIKWLDKNWNKKWPEEGKYFRQLLFYKLLCEVDFEFNSRFDVGSLAIDFVEWKDGIYKQVEVDYSSEEYENFKEELRGARKKINDMEFWRSILNK
jgi:hypothetical protein